MKKFYSYLLSFVLIVMLVPATSFAYGAEGAADAEFVESAKVSPEEPPVSSEEVPTLDEAAPLDAIDPVSEETETSSSDTGSFEPLDAPFTPTLPEGRYRIRPAVSDLRMLDVAGGSSRSGGTIQIYQSNNTQAQFFDISFDPDTGFYTIRNVNSGLVFDVAGGRSTSGTNVQQYVSNGTAAQKWELVELADGSYTVLSALPGKLALDVSGAADTNGANVQIYAPNNTKAQRFFFLPLDAQVYSDPNVVPNGVYTLTSALSSSLVVDVPGGSAANGTQMQLWGRNNTVAQVFELRLEADGFFSVRSLNSGKVLDVSGNNIVASTSVIQYTSNNTTAQRWAIQDNGDGTYTLLAKTSGLALDVRWGSATSGAKLQVYYPNNTNAQKFTIQAASTDTLFVGIGALTPRADTAKRVDITSGSKSPGARAQVYASNKTAAQKFEIALVAPSTYTFRSLVSGLYLTQDATILCQQPAAGIGTETAPSQQWVAQWIYGGIQYTNADTGDAITLSGSSLILAAPTGAHAEAFITNAANVVEPGYYVIKSVSGLALDVASGSTSNGANVQLYTSNSTAAQKWNLKLGADGFYTIASARSGKALDISGGKSVEGTNIQIYSANSTAAQKWKPVPSGDGSYYLKSALGSYLAAVGGGNASGANVLTTNDLAKALKVSFTATSYVPINIVSDFRPIFYHGPKGSAYQKYIVLHDTEGDGSPAAVINYWAGNGRLVAAHFVIGKDGTVYQCVPLDQIAHHAGYGNTGNNARYGVPEDGRDDKKGSIWIGSWSADYGMNAYSIGIEMVHVGGSGYYPEAQLKALDDLIAYIDAYYGFESTIIDHKAWRSGNSDTSPEFANYLRNYQQVRTHNR